MSLLFLHWQKTKRQELLGYLIKVLSLQLRRYHWSNLAKKKKVRDNFNYRQNSFKPQDGRMPQCETFGTCRIAHWRYLWIHLVHDYQQILIAHKMLCNHWLSLLGVEEELKEMMLPTTDTSPFWPSTSGSTSSTSRSAAVAWTRPAFAANASCTTCVNCAMATGHSFLIDRIEM